MRHDEDVAPKQHTAEELATEREWLLRQEPGEANQRADEELKRRGVDFGAAYAAFNRGDHDEAERFLQALALPPRKAVAVLERRINDALRAMSKPAVLAQAPAAHVASRPREHRNPSRARARAPDDGERPRLKPAARALLKAELDKRAREVAARIDGWRTCPRCLREQEPDEFSNGAKRCRSCEAERLREYHAKKRRDREAV